MATYAFVDVFLDGRIWRIIKVMHCRERKGHLRLLAYFLRLMMRVRNHVFEDSTRALDFDNRIVLVRPLSKNLWHSC